MQQSDDLLLTSLKEFLQIPSHIKNLNDFQSDEIFTISLNFLECLGHDTSEIKSIEKQKFRSTTRLNQMLFKDLGIQLQLNDLLNPTLAFVRKTLLMFLAKINSQDDTKFNKGTKQQQQSFEKRKKKLLLKNWLEQQWIHPSLANQSPSYSAFVCPLPLNRKLVKSNILPLLSIPSLKPNTLSILSTTLNKNEMKLNLQSQNVGINKKEDFNVQRSRIVNNNYQDWNINQQRISKIKRKLQKDQINQAQKLVQTQNQHINDEISVFKKEVQTKLEQKDKQLFKESISISTQETQITNQVSDNPFQKLKQQAQHKKKYYQSLIQKLLQQAHERKCLLQQYQQQKLVLGQKIVNDEQKLTNYKQRTQQLKRLVQKKQLVLTAIQQQKPIQEQILQYQEDITSIQKQIQSHTKQTILTIQNLTKQSHTKIQSLKDLKIKLNRIEISYKQVNQQIQDKLNIKAKIKIQKSGISRIYYSRKIMEIDKRWRDTQREVNKITKDLKNIQKTTNLLNDLTDQHQAQIINLINNDKNKNQTEAKDLKAIFLKCQATFKSTMETLRKISQVKEQNRQYQVKVHALSSQNYTQGIEKLNIAVMQLKRQVQEASRRSKI